MLVAGEDEVLEEISLLLGNAALYSSRSPDKATPNEDCALIFEVGDDACVLAVADGVGGGKAGREASRIALEALADSVRDASLSAQDLRGAILNGFEAANEAVLALGIGAATTLAVAEIQSGVLRSYHAGDSFVMLTGQKGKVKLQTIDHSPTGYGQEAGMLDATEAMHHDERHIVFNVIGSREMRIEIGSPIELAARDTVIVASDGLSDNLLLPEIVETVRAGKVEDCTIELSKKCRARMVDASNGHPSKPDDLTFIVFRLR